MLLSELISQAHHLGFCWIVTVGNYQNEEMLGNLAKSQ